MPMPRPWRVCLCALLSMLPSHPSTHMPQRRSTLHTCTATARMLQLWAAVMPSGEAVNTTHWLGGRYSFMLAASRR